MAGLQLQTLHTTLDEDPFEQQGVQSEDGAYDELNAPEYSTDEFRMFHFKVERCPKRCVHDWRLCPFAHPTENARRRDPRLVRYAPIPCPEYKRGICLRGDACGYAHGVYECWLHPARYRTQLCKEGASCHRPVCFFAHSASDLRQPSHQYSAPPSGLATPVQGSGGQAPQQPSTNPRARQGSPRAVSPFANEGMSKAHEQPKSSPVSAGPRKTANGAGAEAPSTPEPIRAHSCSSTSSMQQLSTLLSPRGGATAPAFALGPEGASTPRMSNAVARKLGLAPQRGGNRRGAPVAPAPFSSSVPNVQPQHGFRVPAQGAKSRPAPGPALTTPALNVAAAQEHTIPAAYSEGGLAGVHPAWLSFMAAKNNNQPLSPTPQPSSELLQAEDSQMAGLETVGSVLAGLGGLGLEDEPAVFQLSCSATATPQAGRDNPARGDASPSAKHWGQFHSPAPVTTAMSSSWGPSPALASAFSTPRGGVHSGSFLTAAFPSSLDAAFLPDHLNSGAFFQPSPSPLD